LNFVVASAVPTPARLAKMWISRLVDARSGRLLMGARLLVRTSLYSAFPSYTFLDLAMGISGETM
jgi:hypothetical protein